MQKYDISGKPKPNYRNATPSIQIRSLNKTAGTAGFGITRTQFNPDNTEGNNLENQANDNLDQAGLAIENVGLEEMPVRQRAATDKKVKKHNKSLDNLPKLTGSQIRDPP